MLGFLWACGEGTFPFSLGRFHRVQFLWRTTSQALSSRKQERELAAQQPNWASLKLDPCWPGPTILPSAIAQCSMQCPWATVPLCLLTCTGTFPPLSPGLGHGPPFKVECTAGGSPSAPKVQECSGKNYSGVQTRFCFFFF